MPRVSYFFGIAIWMYYEEHNPPHFHAKYQDDWAQIRIADGVFVKGTLPKRVRAMVLEWWADHRDELMANWERAQLSEAPLPIAPLE
jgi:hypothetical protein